MCKEVNVQFTLKQAFIWVKYDLILARLLQVISRAEQIKIISEQSGSSKTWQLSNDLCNI